MKYIVTAAEMRRYDSNTIETIGIPSCVLMERAALAAMEAVEAHFGADAECGDGRAKHSVLIMAGMGNNGGDGLALARLLSERRYDVEVWCVGSREKASEQWRQQEKILRYYPVRMSWTPARESYEVLVDALFGVGLSKAVSGEFAHAVRKYNVMEGFKLSLDLPSGVNSDTGEIMGCAVRAQETVSFGFLKRGLVLYPGCENAGRVTVSSIGISQRSFMREEPQMFALDEKAEELLPGRAPDGNKGTFGKVLLVAGSRNMAGAAVLSAKAAYRIGAGMVKAVTPEENRVVLQTCVPEALVETGENIAKDMDGWADTVLIGPGLGRDERALGLLTQAVEESGLPLVVDADGLNLLSENPRLLDVLGRQGDEGRKIILTPHVGELSRLTGQPVSELKKGMLQAAKELAGRIHGVVAAKDARTLICREKDPVCINLTGNSGMATAGSGDVLAGMAAGLLAQGMDAFEAACVGVYLHGMAGDAAARILGEHACTAGDIVEAIGKRFRAAGGGMDRSMKQGKVWL